MAIGSSAAPRATPSPLWRRLALVALVAGIAALAGLPARATRGARVSGDEPQYLLTATSLTEDGDLDIADELATAAYLPYHEVPIDPQTAVLDDGRRLSPHDPLLAFLLALPMAAAGWIGAKATLAGFAAATAALTLWLTVHRFDVGPTTATVVVAGAFAGIPLAAYGGQVYPEMPAAFALCIAVAAATTAGPGRWPLVVGATAVVALPWLALKYVPQAVVAALALLWRARRADDGRDVPATGGVGRWATSLVRLFLGFAVAAAVYVLVHRRVYGGWTVYATGDHFADRSEFSVAGTDIDVIGRSRRLAGLLVDRAFGLVVWSPLWILLAPAAGRALRHRRGPNGLALALLAVTWAVATFVALTMHGWWVPGRQLVVGLPLGVVLVAGWVDRSAGRRRVAAALGLVGAINWLWLAVEASTGRRTLIVDFADTASPAVRLLAPLLPDGIRGGLGDSILLAAWSVVLVAALAVGARERSAPS